MNALKLSKNIVWRPRKHVLKNALKNMFIKKCHFRPPDNVFYAFKRAHEFPGRKMMQNDLEFSSKNKF